MGEREKAYLRQEHLKLGEEASRELNETRADSVSFSYQFLVRRRPLCEAA